MTAVDRAFIKAYTARRSMRGAPADVALEPRASMPGEPALARGVPSYRVDGPHASAVPHAAVPHAKTAARKPRQFSAETAKPAPAPQAVAAIDRAASGERAVDVPTDAANPPDWIWQRQPHPVFADQASTAGPALGTPSAKAQPKAPLPADPKPKDPQSTIPESLSPQPTVLQPTKAPSSKVLSPDILSLTLASVGAAPPSGPVATASPRSAAAPLASPISGPLSSFSLTPRIEERLQPALEVDHFLWPAEIAELGDRAAAALEAFAAQLIDGARRGQRRVALVGAAAGAGTTTVGLCLARLARVKGATWGLLDADFESAALASRLGIAQAAGWQAVLSGRERLADVAIASLDDHLVFVPLSAEGLELDELAANFRAPALFSMLADIVDLMLVDAGTVAAEPLTAGPVTAGAIAAGKIIAGPAVAGPAAVGLAEQQPISRLTSLVRAARLDAVYLVYDERSTTAEELAACAGRLEAAGVSVAGTIANFAAA